MSTETGRIGTNPGGLPGRRGKPSVRVAVAAGVVVILIAAMAFDTRVVRIGSRADVHSNAFSAAAYGKSEFPKVQAAVESRATDAATLAVALSKDQAAAEKQYGVAADGGPELSVKFTGKAGKQDSGVYDVAVPGVPGSIHISVQTGPAINGTDLRDATGMITFGQFSNQIDYQNAGSALNNEMKKQIVAKVDTAKLTGKTISVVGVFQLSDPNDWTVTPVKLAVQ
jgi:predicted lipoprotein